MLFRSKQADKEGLINGDEVIPFEEYERRVEAWKRIIQSALSAQTKINSIKQRDK